MGAVSLHQPQSLLPFSRQLQLETGGVEREKAGPDLRV